MFDIIIGNFIEKNKLFYKIFINFLLHNMINNLHAVHMAVQHGFTAW